MHTETLNTPRTTQAAALNHQALTPNERGNQAENAMQNLFGGSVSLGAEHKNHRAARNAAPKEGKNVMKSEIFDRLLAELLDDLANPEIAAEIEAGELGYRLYCSGPDEFELVGDAYFAREVPDRALEESFDGHGDCCSTLNLQQTADRAAAREALEVAVQEVEVYAEEMKARRED